MAKQEDQPKNSWRWVRISAVLLLILVAIGVITISSGIFDPKPIGKLVTTYRLDSLVVAAKSSQTIWLDMPKVGESTTLRLTAAHQRGEIDASYGLAIGNDLDLVIVALSPAGYLSVQRRLAGNELTPQESQLIPWQTWPHIRTDNLENEIWVDIEDGFVTSIRINRELLTQENIPLTGRRIGLAAQSFGEESTFDFLTLGHFVIDEK